MCGGRLAAAEVSDFEPPQPARPTRPATASNAMAVTTGTRGIGQVSATNGNGKLRAGATPSAGSQLIGRNRRDRVRCAPKDLRRVALAGRRAALVRDHAVREERRDLIEQRRVPPAEAVGIIA